MKQLITVLAIGLMSVAFQMNAQVVITDTDNYMTKDQMLLANEINESGEPFAEALGYNLDDLDPMVLNQPDSISYTMGIENYEYSRYHLGTVISRSGIGLHMMWSPIIMQMAAMEPDGFDGSFTDTPNGYNEDDELIKNMMHFAMLSNGTPPQHPWPQYAEFRSGNPHLPQDIDADNYTHDFATLRWDRSQMDKTLNLAAMGQTLMKQYLWAQDMLGTFHDGDENEVVPDGVNTPDYADSSAFDPNNNIYYGGDNLDGFIGQILTAEAINKVKFTIMSLAYNGTELGMVDPATYDPANGIQYFPHGIEVTEAPVIEGLPPIADNFTVTDNSSQLWDQLSFLWGTLNFRDMMDPNNFDDPPHIAYKSVFDGDPFPGPMSETGVPGPFDLMMGTSKVIFMNLNAMHFNSTEGTFVDESGLENGTPTPGSVISAVNAGYALVMMAKFANEFAGTPLENPSLNMLNAQASFILNNFQDADGGFMNSVDLNGKRDNSDKTAVAQAAIARGLYAAYDKTENQDYLDGANAAYHFLIDNYYVPQLKAFRTELNNEEATYTPFNFAVIAGALREGVLVGNNEEGAAIYTRFFKTVANAMQLSEDDHTGETGNDSDGDGIPFIPEQPDNLPPVFAAEATMDMTVTGIKDYEDLISSESITSYPNPFKVSTTLVFDLPESSRVSIRAYNITGQMVEEVFNGVFDKGLNSVSWTPAASLNNGIYYLRIGVNNVNVASRKVVKMN